MVVLHCLKYANCLRDTQTIMTTRKIKGETDFRPIFTSTLAPIAERNLEFSYMNYKEILHKTLKYGVPKQPTRIENGVTKPVENPTIGIFGAVFEHDMSEGFPLSGLRKLPFKSTCVELEMILKGITDKKFLKDRGCGYWDWWCRPSETSNHPNYPNLSKSDVVCIRDLGPLGYSHEFRNFGGYCPPVAQIYSPYLHRLDNLGDYINLGSKSKHVGKTYKSNSGEFLVVDAKSTSGSDRRTFYTIIFTNTGFMVEGVSGSNILKGNLKDLYAPHVLGVGCIGEKAKKSDPLYQCWKNMLQRCYYPKDANYKNYGGRGVRVCNRWLNASNFFQDATELKNWGVKRVNWRKYSLDKDIFGCGLMYSPENCCWATERDQKRNTNKNITFKATHVDGTELVSSCIKDFSTSYGVDPSWVSKALKDPKMKVKGWGFCKIDDARRAKDLRGVDQLENLVYKLRNTPYDRRMIVSNWNPQSVDESALPPCHLLHNVCVYGDTLNLWWHQRSVDILANATITTYALLMLLYCKESGLKPGVLKGSFVDCHLYENQIPAAKIILERDEPPLPQVEILSKPDGSFSIFDWTHKDVLLTNYHPHGKVDIGAITI